MTKATPQQDLFFTQDSPQKHVYTVSEITQEIKILLEHTFGQVWVEGEVSNFRPSSAGHFYFSLKDQNCILQAVLFNRQTREVGFKLEDGLKIICLGNVEVYGPRGQYQLIVEKIEPKGAGSLQLALEQLKKKLEKEGLFSPEHKRALPELPSCIGVVTSLQGAAIKDIIKVLERRFKDPRMIIYPVRVQGEGAKEDIAQAIQELNAFNASLLPRERIEVMIVGRGGGSVEDLWAFNEEVVARAIYNSRIPVVSAVGHERDWTIADLVADLRAATPSQAAEMIIPQKEELKSKITSLAEDLKGTLIELTLNLKDRLEDLAHRQALSIDHLLELNAAAADGIYKKLALLNPQAVIRRYQEKLLYLADEISLRAGHLWKSRQQDLARSSGKLVSLSPLNVLSRGFSITFDSAQGTVIKDAGQLTIGALLKTRLRRGEFISEVKEVEGNGGDEI